MKQLLPHQVKFAKGYSDKAFLVHEGGTGKTVCSCVWLRDGRDSDALVITEKRILEKWKIALDEWGTKATVVSKEQFKKLPRKRWSAVVVDEADNFASALFTKGRSQLSVSLYELVKAYDMPILLATATPVRSTPWNLHTLLCFKGYYIDWKKWREAFFSLERRPYLRFPAWLEKTGWQGRMQAIIAKHSDVVLLKDCVGYLPPSTEITTSVPCSPYKRNPDDPITGLFVAEHRHEQENKAKEIISISKGYRKVLVVAHYVEQVKELEKVLSKNRQTFTVYGSIKNQEQILDEANKSDECFLIVQASLGVGFDADTFSCMVFASMSYKAKDWVQMKYRVRRINNLHPVVYYYLIGGRCDKAVKKTIDLGKDFLPSEWKQDE